MVETALLVGALIAVLGLALGLVAYLVDAQVPLAAADWVSEHIGSKVLFLPSTEEGVSEVARNPNAIFYPGLGYVTEAVKPLAIKQTADTPGVLPSVETALDGSYPIARPLLFYTNGEPASVIKDFIDYCLSTEGQAKVTEVGYVPLQ